MEFFWTNRIGKDKSFLYVSYVPCMQFPVEVANKQPSNTTSDRIFCKPRETRKLHLDYDHRQNLWHKCWSLQDHYF